MLHKSAFVQVCYYVPLDTTVGSKNSHHSDMLTDVSATIYNSVCTYGKSVDNDSIAAAAAHKLALLRARLRCENEDEQFSSICLVSEDCIRWEYPLNNYYVRGVKAELLTCQVVRGEANCYGLSNIQGTRQRAQGNMCRESHYHIIIININIYIYINIYRYIYI